MTTATRLEKLVLHEISGVDDPANEAPGFALFKNATEADAEALLLELASGMEATTKAADSGKPYGDVTYADPGYQEDKKKRYPLDTETHIRAAWSYVNQKDNAAQYSADDLAKIKARISAAMKKIGADVSTETAKKDSSPDSGVQKDATTIFGRLRKLVGIEEEGDDLEMDRTELEGILKEREDALLEGVAAVVKGLLPETKEEGEVEKTESADESVEKDATDDGEKDETVEKDATDESTDSTDEKDESVEKDATPALTSEDVVKAITEALAPHTEVAEALLARITAVEERFAGVARKSLEGQEGGTEADEAPTLTTKSAFDAALQGRKVELR